MFFYRIKKDKIKSPLDQLITTLGKKGLLKTLSKKEKMLVFSIFNNVFYPMKTDKTKSPFEQLKTTLGKKPLENIVEKGENAGNQHFLHFQQCFLPYQKRQTMHHLTSFKTNVLCKYLEFVQSYFSLG